MNLRAPVSEHASTGGIAEPSVRPPIILGVSLKLYLNIGQSVEWARAAGEIAAAHPAVTGGAVQLFVLPSLPALAGVREALGDAPVAVGAQDLFWEDRGAYTGAVSGSHLREAGCRYVEVGHAERRNVFGEAGDVIRRKFTAAVRNSLTPVLCVGERQKQTPDAAASACVAQLESALNGVEDRPEGTDVIVAYEPEWAIGQTSPATPEHVATTVAALRERLARESWLGPTAVIYGGSAKPGLLSTLGSNVDGLFLGRFAHDPSALKSIIDEAAVLR